MESPPSSDDEPPDPAVTGKSEDTGVPAASGVKDTVAVRKFVFYFLLFARDDVVVVFIDHLLKHLSPIVFSNCHQEGTDSPPPSDDETPDPAVTDKSEDTGVPAASGFKDTAAVRKFVFHLRNFVYIFFDHLRKFVLSSGSGGFPSLQRRQNTPLQ